MPAASSAATPAAPYHVGELSVEDGMDIAMWKTPGPWRIQDSLETPRPDEGYWAVRDATQQLIGFCCFGEDARVPGLAANPATLDVALGLAPQLTGRRLSHEFAAAVVAHGRVVAADRRLRCIVASWNAAGRRTAEAVGFQVVGFHEVRGGAATASYFVFELPGARSA